MSCCFCQMFMKQMVEVRVDSRMGIEVLLQLSIEVCVCDMVVNIMFWNMLKQLMRLQILFFRDLFCFVWCFILDVNSFVLCCYFCSVFLYIGYVEGDLIYSRVLIFVQLLGSSWFVICFIGIWFLRFFLCVLNIVLCLSLFILIIVD